MNKHTASELLAILKQHDPECWLTTGADHRVELYLHAVRVLPRLVEGVRDDVAGLLTPDSWEELRTLSSDLGDAAELARVLDSVQVVSEVWDA